MREYFLLWENYCALNPQPEGAFDSDGEWHYDSKDGNIEYIVSLGEISRTHASLIEQSANSFEWVQKTDDLKVTKHFEACYGRRVIFTDDANDRGNIEGRNEVIEEGRYEVIAERRDKVIEEGHYEVTEEGRYEVTAEGRYEVIAERRYEVIGEWRDERHILKRFWVRTLKGIDHKRFVETLYRFDDDEKSKNPRFERVREIMRRCQQKCNELRAEEKAKRDAITESRSAACAPVGTDGVVAIDKISESPVKTKKNGEKQHSNSAFLIIAELATHHRIDKRKSHHEVNTKPHTVRGIRKVLGESIKSTSTVSDFFKKHFHDQDGTSGHKVYAEWCKTKWNKVFSVLSTAIDLKSRELPTSEIEAKENEREKLETHREDVKSLDARIDAAQ